MTAGLLGIFLGGVNIHNLYLGYTGKAIEGIMILTGTINKDANGVPLKE